MKEDRDGWGLVDPTDTWVCPECHMPSCVDDWKEVGPPCEDCGNHDGRECPLCEEWFDNVWGDEKIQKAIEDYNEKVLCRGSRTVGT